ncbi:MAG: NAD(P)/FAD-dependent oxidoreductase [Pseudomonadota bacterium]
MTNSLSVDYLIIGSGFGGLCMAAKLLAEGRDNLLIVEKAVQVGGTWRENVYPGAECDIPSSLYSYSFWPNPTWDFKWSGQAQILDYLTRFAEAHGIAKHIQFQSEVHAAAYDQENGLWRVRLGDNQEIVCHYLIPAVGQLHHPQLPVIEGMESFDGISFHSAQWPQGLDLSAKNVGVIGNAASAVQFVPEIAKQAKSVTVYQRSPNWLWPKPNRPYSSLEKWLAKYIPSLAGVYRFSLWLQSEFILYPIIKGNRWLGAIGERVSKHHVKRLVADEKLQKQLIPDYPLGGKRILFTTDYLKAIGRGLAELVTGKIERITPSGIDVTVEGAQQKRQHDVLVYATGFYTNPFLKGIDIVGKNGVKLSQHWHNGAHAYLGVQTAHFPNMFMLYGPNTNTGHTSVVLKHEAQVAMILRLIEAIEARSGMRSIEVKAGAEQKFNNEIDLRLRKMPWNKVAGSWYKDGDRITNNWPGSGREYQQRTGSPILDHFEFA